MREKKIAVVGATGLVGRTILKVLKERDFPFSSLKLLASQNSAGKTLKFKGNKYTVEELTKESFKDVDIALFSAGKTVSGKFAPIATESGAVVVDNSSAWRLNPEIPLVVPEVNSRLLENYRGVIANPNCSTIQLAVVLKPLLDAFGLKRVVVSTYQSISGAGQKGVDRLYSEIKGESSETEHKIAFNMNFHNISDPDGFTEEELKMINETRKILNAQDLPLAMTCVRLPIMGGHGESINIETEKNFEIDELRETLSRAEGVVLMDKPFEDVYPTAAIAEGSDLVYVGRIRKDDSVKNGAYLWIVADNLRKGAATNAVQIAEYFVQ